MPDYIERNKAMTLDFRIAVDLRESKRKTVERAAQAYADAIASLPAADVRPVVLCRDCKWWTKQEASLQGRCELLQMYPTGAWFCANGKREKS